MAEYIEREVLDDFKDDLIGRFIVLCFGNDYNKLSLLTIGNQIDELYEKHSTKPAADVVEVVRCKDCKHWNNGYCWGVPLVGDDASYVATEETDYCSYGEAKMDGKGEG